MKVSRIDHVALAVPDISRAALQLGALGLRAEPPELVAPQQTLVAFVPVGETSLELIAPAGNASLQRFLERRGPGLHHVCLEVGDLAATLDELKARGVRLIDEAPRPGARGHLTAFVHPSATGGLLVELCQSASPAPEQP
jgi:methylmalonyl-CoA/ethylmalonyl-CoA epimerase